MHDLCFNTMNRSAYLLGDEDPDLEGQIDAAGAAGFQCIGPDCYTIDRYCRNGGSLEALAARIEAAGLRTFELPTLSIDTNAEEVRAQTERMLEMARALRPEFVQVNFVSDFDEAAIDEMRRVGERFAECGARLAVEYLPWLPGTRDIETTRELLRRARVGGAGVLVDTWHFTFGDDTWEILDALPLPELAYVQFDDHPPLASDDLVAETLGRRAMPGEGHFELERFCDAIRAKGYTGAVSCEILSDATRSMDRLAFAQQVYTTSRKFWP